MKENQIRKLKELKNDVKLIKLSDRIRYRDVYSTLIENARKSNNNIGRTELRNPPKKAIFRYPNEEENKIDQYHVKLHRQELTTPIDFNKRKNKQLKFWISLDNMEVRPNYDNSRKSSNQLDKHHAKNMKRLKKLKNKEKNINLYDRVSKFMNENKHVTFNDS